MVEIQTVLENLNAAYSKLMDLIAKTDAERKRLEALQITIDERKEGQTKKAQELDVREGNIKHIESIDEAMKNAQEKIAQAAKDKKAIDDAREVLNKERAAFTKQRTEELRKIADDKTMNQKQTDALIKERKEFEDKIKAYKAMSAALK